MRNINSSVFAQKQQQFGYYSYTVAILFLLKLKCAPFSPGFDLRLFPFPSSPSFPGQEVNIMANKKFNIFSITHAESELFSLYVLFAGKRNKLLEPGHLKCGGKEIRERSYIEFVFQGVEIEVFGTFFFFQFLFVCRNLKLCFLFAAAAAANIKYYHHPPVVNNNNDSIKSSVERESKTDHNV